ncbi:hypothetical protein [Adhaeribacter rhizoryzae]|uniref:Uncharacterized protein n=1 Tax=Adhaeribacter rhizoryzae TaxID=2607907 RepID=A0A5M6D2B9_9BACT|nr:hypothetical protein [Adhaeribacter rhizoryzae]KAA5541156.1 hypothetical protein F0145_21220 [Adhaeribacter rhizoryzae]
MNYDPKIIDDYIKSLEYYYFQDFCDRLLITLYPEDYTPVRAGGRKGDMKNDGYCYVSRIFFQAHATRGESAKLTKNKIEEDLIGCLANWDDVLKFVYITNDTLIGEVENFVDALRKKYKKIAIETWGHKRLASKIKCLSHNEIEYIIDRKFLPEISFLNSEVIGAKFLITSEFSIIKEISQNNLSHFPFENPLLFENRTLKFLRSIIGKQQYRHTEIEKSLVIDKEHYLIEFPDAKSIPNDEDEYQFFYHRRTPNREEIKLTLKSDNISQFLLKNRISENRISEIRTCYESECAGAENFQELFIVRPLYAQFLVLKNISNSPIRLKSLESIANDGVLYKKENLEVNEFTNFPKFLIEPGQNIIIPIGLFLSEFKELSESNSDLVSYTYVPNQVQHLKLGALEESPNIEFIGPSFIPKKIIIENKNQEITSLIHDFSFGNIYWLNRHWLFGSCPHLFFVKNGKLKYQGEIFNVLPNQFNKEYIKVPDGVFEVIVAELEQEVTLINQVIVNGNIHDSEIVLKEGEFYSINVFSNDNIELIGKYILNGLSSGILPKNKKSELIEKFKKTRLII